MPAVSYPGNRIRDEGKEKLIDKKNLIKKERISLIMRGGNQTHWLSTSEQSAYHLRSQDIRDFKDRVGVRKPQPSQIFEDNG